MITCISKQKCMILMHSPIYKCSEALNMRQKVCVCVCVCVGGGGGSVSDHTHLFQKEIRDLPSIWLSSSRELDLKVLTLQKIQPKTVLSEQDR